MVNKEKPLFSLTFKNLLDLSFNLLTVTLVVVLNTVLASDSVRAL